MRKNKKPHQFIVKPYYPGGPKALSKFIKKNLKYPKEALKQKIEGVVLLRIDINHKGVVTGSKVKMSLGHGCDEEAQRITSLMQFKLDRVVRKGRTTFHKNIRIGFKLPKKKEQKKTQIKYNIVQTKKSPQNGDSSYNYTISF